MRATNGSIKAFVDDNIESIMNENENYSEISQWKIVS